MHSDTTLAPYRSTWPLVPTPSSFLASPLPPLQVPCSLPLIELISNLARHTSPLDRRRMVDMPSTPMAQTRQLRPRYNNDTIQSQSPFPQIPSQSQSQSHSGTTTNTDTNITGTVPSQVDCTAHASRPLSSSLRTSLVNPADYLQGTSATEGTFSALQTPFIPHTLPTPPTTSQRQIDASPHNRVDPTSNSSQGQSLSRTHVRGPSNDTPPPMASSYPNTPSPPNTYGINGTLIVADPTTMM